MVEIKKPIVAKPATPATAMKPAAQPVSAAQRRPPLPALSPLPTDKAHSKSSAAGHKESTSGNSTPRPESLATAEPGTAPAELVPPPEKIGAKIRKRDDILAALRRGAHVERIDGLCRIVHADGKMNATSKRRIISLQAQKLLIASADGKTLSLDKDADAKARETKATAEPKATEPGFTADTKSEDTK